ncbi:flagellar assembly protein A [Helicobacter burdigaliensis]|uniref:flagellar assembly protein A n=1 Tax=Helicobacter burdigaliensis TaxID=2315334 RepID=UPI000EF6AD93|nr:flagellar assembly protein A [Helicobacter burdigaliensis]
MALKFVPQGFKQCKGILNIPLFIQEQSKRLNIELDYNLLEAKTFFIKQNEETPRIILDINVFNKDSNFCAKVKIKQVYDIEVYRKQERPKRPFHFELKLEENQVLKAILCVDSPLTFSEKLKEEIYQELYKQLISESYLVGVREYQQLSEQIDDFLRQVINNSYSDTNIFDVACGVAPVPRSEGRLVYKVNVELFKETKGERCLLSPVKNGDLLFVYIKPTLGKIGRDLKGNLLVPNNPISSFNLKVLQGIKIKENEEKIAYFAGVDGFLKEVDKDTYTINQNIECNGGEKQVLNIEGATDKKSTIQSEIAFITTHRGNIKANIVVIDTLEKGVVEAKVAFINNALGGVVRADYIYITEMRSYNEIYARYSLVIDTINGDHNSLEINPEKFAFMRRDRLEYVMLSDQIKIKIRHLKQTMDELYAYLLPAQNKVQLIKKEYEEKSEPVPQKFKGIIEQYDKALSRYQDCLKEYKDIANLYFVNEKRLKSINEAALNAKIIIRKGSVSAETFIKFRVYSNGHEELLKLLLPKTSPAKCFKVVQEDDFYRLRHSGELDEKDFEWIERLKPKANE